MSSGKHMICDIKNIKNHNLLNDPQQLTQLLDHICKTYDYTILQISKHEFEPQGFTAVYLLSESHISIHTYPENNYVAIDIYTCRQYDNNQTYKDRSGNILTTTSSANRKSFENQISLSQKRRDELSIRETALNDSITQIDLKKLDLETNADLAGEIGPLKYIAKLTNRPMDVVVNWFIIALMFVFDPLAISLVIAANFAFNKIKNPKELSIYNEKPVEVKPIVTEHKIDNSMVPPTPTKSWYNYIQPAFNKKRDDDVKTY
jgi:S-adenosylmethionine decarboxylase proenzyme